MAYAFNVFTGNFDYYQASGSTTFYSEVLTDSGDHKNFTAVNSITTVISLVAGDGTSIPVKDGSGSTNYTVSGTTLTLSAASATLASLGLNIVYD